MSRSYNEIMDKITVTEEMQERILKNIGECNIAEYRSRKRIQKLRRISWLAGAAAIAIVIGGVTIHEMRFRTDARVKPGEQEEQILVGNGIEECSSLSELEEKVGFEVEDIRELLPFIPEETVYLSYWGDTAEIQYSKGGQTICYRKSEGEEDNSGDYNEYAVEKSVTVDGCEILLKGSEAGISLAIWSRDGFAYSLSFVQEMEEEEILSIVQSM